MIIILASDLTVEQIQSGIIIVDQDTKDYADNVIEWQILGKNQDGANTITVQTKTLVGDGADDPISDGVVGDRRYNFYDSTSSNILNSELQTWLDNDFYNHLGSDFRSKIIPVTKSITPYRDGDITSMECKLFSLSVAEIGGYDLNGSAPQYYTPEEGAFTYQYYQGINSINPNTKRVHSGGSDSEWWLRSPNTYGSWYVWVIEDDGYLSRYATGGPKDGPAPACVLPSDIELELIDGETNKYNIVWGNSDIISASDLTVEQIQNGIVIVDQDTKDYNNNVIEWQVLGKDQDGNGTITVQTKTCVGDGAEGYGDVIGDRRYDPSRNKLDSELQVWLDTDFYNHIGSNFKDAIIPTTKAINPYQEGDISSRECKLFNLSLAEVGGYDLNGDVPAYYTPEPNAFTYQYYQGIESITATTKRVHTGGSNSVWWLRTPYETHSTKEQVKVATSDGRLLLCIGVDDTDNGPSPACVLPSSTKLKLIDGETNKYSIVWDNSGSGNSDPSQNPDPTPSPTPSDLNAKNFVSYGNMYNILSNLDNSGKLDDIVTVDSATETMIFNWNQGG